MAQAVARFSTMDLSPPLQLQYRKAIRMGWIILAAIALVLIAELAIAVTSGVIRLLL